MNALSTGVLIMTVHNYPKIMGTDDNPVSELQEDYDMSDPEKSKIVPLSTKRRLGMFERLSSENTMNK